MSPNRRMALAVAPMMEYTDRHYRYLARLLSRKVELYTEMVVDQTILHQRDNLDRFLGFHPAEHPVVLQLGGSCPETLAECAAIGEEWGYDSINLNVGCPSPKVCGNKFGARLMLDPELVRQIVVSMQRRVSVPVTVKCRLGVDDQEEYEHVKSFVNAIPECDHFIIHARNCLLNGLNPKQNRTIPPLKYDFVHRLTEDFPDKQLSLNGGVKTIDQARELLDSNPKLYGIMIGRSACNDTAILGEVDYKIYGEDPLSLTRREVIEKYLEYCHDAAKDEKTSVLVKPLSGLAFGAHGSSKYRQRLHQADLKMNERNEDIDAVVRIAMSTISDDFWDIPIVQEQQHKDKDQSADVGVGTGAGEHERSPVAHGITS